MIQKANDIEMVSTGDASLDISSLEGFAEPSVASDGAIILCRKGEATMHIDFSKWRLTRGAVITLFPGDVVRVCDTTEDFEVEMLRYPPSMLREASLQLEQTVYSKLREDRCRSNTAVVTSIVEAMFALLGLYFRQRECACKDELVVLQLKAFFLGFYDWLRRNPEAVVTNEASQRVEELFNKFMQQLEAHYRDSHDVAYYASLLHITPKYLSTIVRRKTRHTPKVIIDHYVVLQLKLSLRTSSQSIKELAAAYHFSDQSFFCRYFKQHTGQTPLEFRGGVISGSEE